VRAGDRGFESPQVRGRMNLKDKRTLSILASVLFGVILIVVIFFKYPFREVISTFTNFTPTLVLLYLIVSVLIMVTLSFRWKVILNALGHKIAFYKLFGYRVIGYGISYITPSAKVGGEPVRAALLKRRGLSFKEGLSSVVIDKTLELSISAFFFIAGVLLLVVAYAIPGEVLTVLIILSLIFLILVWIFYARILKGKPVFAPLFKLFRLHKFKFLSKYHNAILNFEKPIIHFYRTEKKAFFTAAALSILSLALSMLEYKLVLLMLGINAPLGIVFVVLSLAGFAFMIPLPMALGSFEAFQASFFSIAKLGPPAAGIGVAMITRSRDLLWVLGALILSFYIGSFKNIIKKAFVDKPVLGVKLKRDGQKHTIDIKINRPR